MFRQLRILFLSGLAALLPIVLTLYLLYWLVVTADRLLGRWVAALLPSDWSLPGVGLAAALGLILLSGLLLRVWGIRQLVRMGQELLERLPLVRLFYAPLRELSGLIAPGGDNNLRGQPVAVRLLDEAELIGFVTAELVDGALGRQGELVAVYLPMSYQLGGYTLFLPARQLRKLDLSAEAAMRLALTAGVSGVPGSKAARGKHSGAVSH